jgi:adenosylhomocysteinase
MQKPHIASLKLSKRGEKRIEWAMMDMPVLNRIRETFIKEKPLKGISIACCLHVTTETANLVITLKDGGAVVSLCASNPLSTQDDVAAALVKNHGIFVYAVKGESRRVYYRHILNALEISPNITMDDGADLVSTIHRDKRAYIKDVTAGTEETTTGVIRLRSMAASSVLEYPIIAVNEAHTKHLFDNRYGTGQSTIDGILRATNRLMAGSEFVVSGYGWCGKGLAMRARGMGASVIITEVDPLRALEAVMDGFRVMPMNRAARKGDIFCTVTGDINVIDEKHFLLMKDGAMVCNSGHFNVEINIDALEKLSVKKREIRDYVVEYTLRNGRRVFLLGEGRLVNLAAAEGHPASVMDMSFANQALSAEYIVRSGKRLENKVYSVPSGIDRKIAKMKLLSMGMKIDRLTARQREYLSSWEEGT